MTSRHRFMGDPEQVTLAEARQWLREVVDDGASCPCCTQLAKVYRRKVHATMAAHLIRFYRLAGEEWAHYPTLFTGASRLGGDFAKLSFWHLVEEETERREDGGRAGWWRVRPAGVEWLRHRSLIPKYARVYDGRCLGYDGPPFFAVPQSELRPLQELREMIVTDAYRKVVGW